MIYGVEKKKDSFARHRFTGKSCNQSFFGKDDEGIMKIKSLISHELNFFDK